jgi:adenine-specific DNA-methyltransferase
MESLLYYDGLRGKVQMIYIDPPYGIRYNSNFQQRVDSTKNDERDRADDVLTIKAFRDTWALGIHSYLSYLQERLYLCRELLTESGSIFIQMGEENLHLARSLMDEVFGMANYVTTIAFRKSGSSPTTLIGNRYDYLLWYTKNKSLIKSRSLYNRKKITDVSSYRYKESPEGKLFSMSKAEQEGIEQLAQGWRPVQLSNLATEGAGNPDRDIYVVEGKSYSAGAGKHWKTSLEGLDRLITKQRIVPMGSQLNYKRYFEDFPWIEIDATWDDSGSAGYSSTDPKVYVVQTDTKVIARCLYMTTEPGDLVLCQSAIDG